MATEDPRIVNIVRKAKKGNQKAFNQLLKMVEPDLKKIASHFFILGGDRDDVLQELRLGVLKAVNSYDPTKDTTFKNFCVNLVCKRHLATAISSAKRMKNSILNESVSLDAPIILGDDGNLQTLADFIPDRLNPFDESPETNLIQDIIIREEYEQTSKLLIDKLTPLEEDIFVEYGFNSSYKEISNSLQVPPKCVDNALTRIRKKASEVYIQYSLQETNLIRQKSLKNPEPSPEE
jgi:RNA polymerase sporulation-specific sigma factor